MRRVRRSLLAVPGLASWSHIKLDKDNLSYIEHIFEISRRPDLLTMVVDYRTRVLKISEEDELDTKLTRIPVPRSTKTLSGSPLRKRSSNWLLHRRRPEQGGGRGGRLDLHRTTLFPHPPGEGARAPPATHLLTWS